MTIQSDIEDQGASENPAHTGNPMDYVEHHQDDTDKMMEEEQHHYNFFKEFQQGLWLQLLMICPCFFYFAAKMRNSKYTGNPNDYVSRFSIATAHFPDWPVGAQRWASRHVTCCGKGDVDKGIKSLTRTLVHDAMNYHKTLAFPSEAKADIAQALFADETYMAEARKQWGPDAKYPKGGIPFWYTCWSTRLSFLSFGIGMLSILCCNAVLSVGSCNAILSIGSLNSILSVASVNSILAVGCVGKSMKVCF